MTALPSSAMSVVVPVHDVAEYLPEFLASLDAQGDALPSDVLFIDDGSTDASAALIDAWLTGGSGRGRMLRTENRGVSAARNTGLDEVQGEWVLFLDPDDMVAPGYFDALLRFLAAHGDVDLVATNLLRLQEPDHRLRDIHPLRFRFAGGDRAAELGGDVFVMNAASVAFPVAAVRASQARFPMGLHASEDALFVAEYLLSLGRTPRAGFAAGAKYGYRKRLARTSAVDRYRSDPSTYTVRFEDGYRPLLDRAAAGGPVPSWLQSMLLYEMQWLLPAQMDPQRFADDLGDEQKAATLDAISVCLRHVDDDHLLRYDATALPLECRLLILALTRRPLWDWVGAYARLPQGWRARPEVVTYSTAAESAPPTAVLSWQPDYFGQRSLNAHLVTVTPRQTRLNTGAGTVPVVWPRPGESSTQAQDRHRREIAGEDGVLIPPREGEVFVWRTRSWANGRKHRALIRREQRRRGIWSKDAVIGRLLRPGKTWLIEHDRNDSAAFSLSLRAALATVERVKIANAKDAAALPHALRFGSLAHRIARARADVIVRTHPSDPPSLRARVRATRLLALNTPLTTASLRAVRRFGADGIVGNTTADASSLRSIGIAERFATTSSAQPGDLADALRRLRIVLKDHENHAG